MTQPSPATAHDRAAYVPPAKYTRSGDNAQCCPHAKPVAPGSCEHCWELHEAACEPCWARQLARMTQRIPLDELTSDALDQLYADLDELRAELADRDEEARERWIQRQLDETGLKAMDFRNGMTMEIQPARELVAHWVGAARAMLGDAPNYTETPIEMEVKVGESPERFAFVLQRVGKLTPHQARQQAEQRAERAEAAIERVRKALDDAEWGGPDRHDVITEIRAALDEQQEQPAAPAVHVGGNAEDCPACQQTGFDMLAYPWTCPGSTT